VLAELGIIELSTDPGQAFHVAVPVGVDRVAERVAGRGFSVGSDAKDLAAEGVLILRVGTVLRVAGTGVEVPVGAEFDPTTLVVLGATRNAGQYRLRGLTE